MSASQVEPAGQLAYQPLVDLVRDVNRRIAARSDLAVVALACECASRDCEAAFEVPLTLFQVVDARPGLFVVAPGHAVALGDRVVRQERRFLVVERRR